MFLLFAYGDIHIKAAYRIKREIPYYCIQYKTKKNDQNPLLLFMSSLRWKESIFETEFRYNYTNYRKQLHIENDC